MGDVSRCPVLPSGGLVFTAADVCLDQCGEHCRMSNFELGGVLLSAFLIQVKLSNALG